MDRQQLFEKALENTAAMGEGDIQNRSILVPEIYREHLLCYHDDYKTHRRPTLYVDLRTPVPVKSWGKGPHWIQWLIARSMGIPEKEARKTDVELAGLLILHHVSFVILDP